MKIKRGNLYLANLNPRRGTEAGKYRPVVVIQNDLLNEAGHTSTWVLPCTTRVVPLNFIRVRMPRNAAGNSKECDVMIDQSRAIDNKRFKRELGAIPPLLFEEMIEKLKLVGDF